MRGLGATALVRDMPLNPAPYRFTGARLKRVGEPDGLERGGQLGDAIKMLVVRTFLSGTKILSGVDILTFISSDIPNQTDPAYCELLWLSKSSKQNEDNAYIYVGQEDFIWVAQDRTYLPGVAYQSVMVNYKKDKNIPECVIGMRSASETLTVWANETLVGSAKTPPDTTTFYLNGPNYPPLTRSVALGFAVETRVNKVNQPPKDPDQFILLQPHEFRYPERLQL